ncbi:asparaginase [Hydrogenophaga sp.]|uniref:asparaginase n=1 Tax=Hydrogenophaga sp. TaxID=1904254 RepID=UPI002614F89E|nr:asparaginase [Hydrogenophaga sp.]MCW5654717.1 asparaginase [Hydrogenophaga sp.]
MPAATALPRHVPVAVAYRGGHPENIHHGSVAVVNTRGELLASVGDVETPLFTRSALKPFQAMPLVARNAETQRLEDADIALLCASHSGEPMHVERAASLLARIGADETTLACGTHVPFFFGANGLTPPPEARFNRLHHNCSGKHTGMLLLADALGAPLSGYLDRAHPVQQEIARSVSHFMDVPMHRLVLGTDGCSAPNYAVPLRALAQGFARLTLATPDAAYGEAPLRVARAMSRHPELVSGRGRNDLSLMRAGRGDWVSKVGADGVQALASFSRGIGIAAKVSDGQLTPLMVAVIEVLEQLGWLDDDSRTALARLMPAPLKNAAGIEVGEMRAVLSL